MLNFWECHFFHLLWEMIKKSKVTLLVVAQPFFSFLWNVSGICSGIGGYCLRSSYAFIDQDALRQSGWKDFSSIVFYEGINWSLWRVACS